MPRHRARSPRSGSRRSTSRSLRTGAVSPCCCGVLRHRPARPGGAGSSAAGTRRRTPCPTATAGGPAPASVAIPGIRPPGAHVHVACRPPIHAMGRRRWGSSPTAPASPACGRPGWSASRRCRRPAPRTAGSVLWSGDQVRHLHALQVVAGHVPGEPGVHRVRAAAPRRRPADARARTASPPPRSTSPTRDHREQRLRSSGLRAGACVALVTVEPPLSRRWCRCSARRVGVVGASVGPTGGWPGRRPAGWR